MQMKLQNVDIKKEINYFISSFIEMHAKNYFDSALANVPWERKFETIILDCFEYFTLIYWQPYDGMILFQQSS